jgi:hypothetical protein
MEKYGFSLTHGITKPLTASRLHDFIACPSSQLAPEFKLFNSRQLNNAIKSLRISGGILHIYRENVGSNRPTQIIPSR